VRTQGKQISVRLVWPFVRVAGTESAAIEGLARAGIAPSDFVDPDARIAHRSVMEILRAYVARTGDTTVGLRAGQSLETGDLEVLEFATRSCATLRDAIKCSARYMHLLNEAAEISLVEGGQDAMWSFRVTDGVPQPDAANDFILASTASFVRRYTGVREPAIEVHVRHNEPAYAATYQEVFGTRVRFGMPHNGFVFSRSRLDQPMLRAQPVVQAAFESRARELSERLGAAGMRHQIMELVMAQLRTGRVSMSGLAREFAMSVATLRRRLDQEGTSFSKVVDDARRALAEAYLRDRRLSISEIAFLLGFSHAPAFYGAFRRWTGTTPSDYRAHVLVQRGDSSVPPPSKPVVLSS